ncbi:hypothetical protein BO70DRAFT_285601 [Aspergillus heteromorphus CBS 117.55]|uniref:Myb-like DNA-binding domain protein n=1 Tax=Aspergillus heteromorphus CBS 117.55 TaxID=1448321 RepID=A0A317WSD7_9EURO|nr:uncharacterized protein BO70DRAFT_285601 [Aspergillus heteromorphus CBS 117.55]PWY89289.1 hypothetical protein BO70DRAFT_285601 [Aspergillus heteromorphus CBS 117.55]
MERPAKRPRLSTTVEPEGEADDIDIHEARAQNDLRLKSIFEGIFEKYGKDFTEVGDEIDLQSGKIVINNGHIQAMDGEDDTGEGSGWLFETDLAAPPDQEEAGDDGYSHLHHADAETGGDGVPPPAAAMPSQTGLVAAQSSQTPTDEAANDDRSSVDSLLDTAVCVQNDAGASRARQAMAYAPSKAGSEKANPAAEASAQSKRVKFSEAVEAIWRVPEISGGFSTPRVNRSRPAPSRNIVRSQSPPGTGSLWALPWSSRRGSSAQKTRARNPQAQRKHHSSPVVCDWSFAETPAGDESDDPLQEDYEPSPTPKGGKGEGPGGSGVRQGKAKGVLSVSSRAEEEQCDHCQQYFAPADYIVHLKQLLLSKPEGRPDQADPRAGGTQTNPVTTSAAKPNPSVATGEAPTEDATTVDDDPSPTKKRSRTYMSPDEARLIATLKIGQSKKWSEILAQLPQKTVTQLQNWHRIHWIDRRANPSPLTRPWTGPEREKLDQLAEQRGLAWPTIRAELRGRPHPEIEFELLRRWAGEADVPHKGDGKTATRSMGKDKS